jgi:oxygen-independent coproporphyrinogen-3 oxidase
VFKHQRFINTNDLPTAADKLLMFENSIEQLRNNNFQYIGIGQFTRTNDELFIAQDQGALHRNVLGYTTGKDQVAIGLGVAAMSQVGDCYSKNASGLFDYYEQLEQGELAIDKGYQCSVDSIIRQNIIEQLICQPQIKFSTINQQFNIDFEQYFARELDSLKAFEYDGLITVDAHSINIHAIGRVLVRNICMVFDSGLSELACGKPLHFQ